ncbi:MAG: HEAT repeat domain-containing protein, partial [Pseudomonas sp.]|uniref:HEAT repeat domain-containing protein n=1 Tax=Pseudomonas sp. TaxID=306 RepID=UPI003C788D83
MTYNPEIEALRPRLQAPDAAMRRIALIDLADLEDPDGLEWLVDSLRNDSSVDVRAQAATLLEAWEDAEVVQALCEALTDAETAVRDAAAQSLSVLKT